jgi:tetratricopeptide (TPR) repeat protein
MTVRARALFENGELGDAEKILGRVASAREPGDLDNLGVVRRARGDAETAARAWDDVLAQDAVDVRALYHLAAVHLAMATGALDQARERPADAAKLRERATRDLQRAAELLGPAASVSPFQASIPRLLAQVQHDLGDSAKAGAAQAEAARLDPGRAGSAPEIYGFGRIVLPALRRAGTLSRTIPHFTEMRVDARAAGLEVVDLGADGRDDLVLAGTGMLLRCDSLPESRGVHWTETRLADASIALERVGLLDSDRIPDVLLFARALPDTLRRAPRDTLRQVFLVRGGKPDPAAEPLLALPYDVRDAELLDVDRDGALDVVIAAAASPGLRLWRNDGRGGFAPEEPLPGIEPSAPMTGVLAADLDTDGYTDLVCVDDLNRLRVLAGRSAGFVDTSTLTGLGGQRARALACADLDADGDLDLLLGNDEGLWAWSNLGWGRFECRAAYRETRPGWADPPRGVCVASIAVVDVDNDGLPDVLTLHFPEPPPALVAETTAESPSGEDTAPSARRLAPLLPVPAAVRPALWRNEGNCVFSEVADRAGIDLLGLAPARPVAADFDRDGDLDLACVGADSLVRVLWNPGSSTGRGLEVDLVDPSRPSACHGARVELYTGGTCRDVLLHGPVGWIGLGAATTAQVVRIVWPDGRIENHLNVQLPERRLKLVRGGQPS